MQELFLREELDCYRMRDMRVAAERARVLDTRLPRGRFLKTEPGSIFRFALRRR
jgi:hypothetical protein